MTDTTDAHKQWLRTHIREAIARSADSDEGGARAPYVLGWLMGVAAFDDAEAARLQQVVYALEEEEA